MAEVNIKKMTEQDLEYVLSIQHECYTEVEPESRSTIQSKLKLAADSCWIAAVDKSYVAYLICHPWKQGSVPELNEENFVLPENLDLFYIHDLAVSRKARGTGVGRMLIDTALNHARNVGFEKVGLIAVQGSSSFWEKFGFENSLELSTENEAKLRAYGEKCSYMESIL